jgi:hypothetical protein
MREIQSRLVEISILPESTVTEVDSFPLPDDTVKLAVEKENPDHSHVSVILGNPERSIPLLRARLDNAPNDAAVEVAALLLGMLGEACAAPALMDRVAKISWDKGWNYVGMGQFGMSLSRLDALIVALGRTGDRRCLPILAEKIGSLHSESEFSHCRALALAACCLRSKQLAAPLAAALGLESMSGHSWLDLADVVKNVDPNPEENDSRTLSLRELALARGLWYSGDFEGQGQRILQEYANDLRGHYANHARAILREKVDLTSPASSVERLAIA